MRRLARPLPAAAGRPTTLSAPSRASGQPATSRPVQLGGGARQLELVNLDRAQDGRPSLTWNACLAGLAVANARRMALTGVVAHAGGAAADLACGLGRVAGENIGYWSGGIDDSRLNAMFMASPLHRANILNPVYRFVGIAWAVTARGEAYIAEEFG